jgi:signal peptidase I
MVGTGNVSTMKVIKSRSELKNQSHLVRDIVEVVALALLIFFVVQLAVQNYQVQGISMMPGLTDGEYVFVNKLAYLSHDPERGDVIVFHWPVDTSKDFIKRVIGLPGDTIVTDSTTVQVDGVVLNEPYVSQPSNPAGRVWKVPANDYFVMGDNRPSSDDSRDWGVEYNNPQLSFVPKNYIVGKAVLVYWPLGSWEIINTYPTVYAQIKQAGQ